jgi:hypothetical protein
MQKRVIKRAFFSKKIKKFASATLATNRMHMLSVPLQLAVVLMLILVSAKPGENLGPIPIPKYVEGFDQGAVQNSKAVLIEAFYDLQCPDSKASYPALKELLQSSSFASQIVVRIQLFPLPYHRNGFLSTQATRVIQSMDSRLVFKWFDLYFEAQDNFTNIATKSLSGDQVIQNMGILAQNNLGIDYDRFLQGIQYGTNSDAESRIGWKYGCSRGVSGTPFFFVNGVYVTNDPGWTKQDWENLLASIQSNAV